MEETSIKPAFKSRIPAHYRRQYIKKEVLCMAGRTESQSGNHSHLKKKKIKKPKSFFWSQVSENVVPVSHTTLIAQQIDVRSLAF